jgi:hypothetical protein
MLALATLLASPPTYAQDPQGRADCAERLEKAEALLEADGHYAYAWKDSWLLAGATFIALNLSAGFHYSDYRRAEYLVRAAQSVLVMLPEPEALTVPDTLRGIRYAESTDPCLALADARYSLELEAADAKEQTGLLAHGLAFAIPLVTSLFVALAVQHWDFAGHGSEGVQTLVSIAIGELQILTYPHGSLKASATSLQLSF